MSIRPSLVFAVAVIGVCLCGCRRAKIDAPTEPVQPAVNVRDLPRAQASAKEQPWFQGLMAAAPEPTAKAKKTGAKERPWAPIDTPLEPAKPEPQTPPAPPPQTDDPKPPTTVASAQAEATALIEELRTRIEAEQKNNTSWSLLRLELANASAGKKSGISVLADVGWSQLYASRPEILFEQLRLEDCMNRLARMAGLRYAQSGRWGNPPITWRGERVSVLDAVQAIAAEHGFSARFVGAGTRLTFLLEKYESRESFLTEVTSALKEQGLSMERGMPTLVISPAAKPSEAAKEQKGPKADTKKGTKDVN